MAHDEVCAADVGGVFAGELAGVRGQADADEICAGRFAGLDDAADAGEVLDQCRIGWEMTDGVVQAEGEAGMRIGGREGAVDEAHVEKIETDAIGETGAAGPGLAAGEHGGVEIDTDAATGCLAGEFDEEAAGAAGGLDPGEEASGGRNGSGCAEDDAADFEECADFGSCGTTVDEVIDHRVVVRRGGLGTKASQGERSAAEAIEIEFRVASGFECIGTQKEKGRGEGCGLELGGRELLPC